MIGTVVEIGAAVFALLYSSKVRKPLTKTISVFLAISMLLHFDTLIGVAPYAPFIFAFISLVAAAECFNSLNLKSRHKTFFAVSSFLIVLVELEHLADIPFHLDNPALSILFLFVIGYFLVVDTKRLKSRLSILVLWSAYYLKWLGEWF